jgi:Asp-tRNA(Asn)/Glu-tRNA(Gln) amidotransferase A subunit family amidase
MRTPFSQALFASLVLCLSSRAQDSITVSDIIPAEKMLDLRFTAPKRDSLQTGLTDKLHTYQWMHSSNLPNDLPLSLWFDPLLPGMKLNQQQARIDWPIPDSFDLPANPRDLAFCSLLQLASLIRHKKISSVDLTLFYLDRLKKYGDRLHCVIELTEELAMAQARRADADLARGIYRSPLQGIPYGIKDLFAVKGTHTTWGSPPFRDQLIDRTCFVAQQLERAGAVLVAKLSLGELAMDDRWFGGLTRNPWNPDLGSGGSSAGSAAATAAGLVPFAIGTETYGSIVDPSSRCGATGFRPSYGSIARTGAMTLAWSSDKIGPICRSAQDAALVFSLIHGADGVDASSRTVAFNFQEKMNIHSLRVAYARNYIDSLAEGSPEKKTLARLRELGARIVPIDFPNDLHGDQILSLIIFAEGAAAFDPLTRSNRDDEMVQQNKDRWPNTFRLARFIPAVEYINACRMRYRIMQQIAPLFQQYDIIIAPPETGDQLAITNLTGNPSVTLPNGFTREGLPTAISFIGRLYDDGELLAFAKQYQDATPFHLRHPEGF